MRTDAEVCDDTNATATKRGSADALPRSSSWILEAHRSLEPKNYVNRFVSSNVRPDSRPLHASRPASIVTSVLPRNSNGSALVSLGTGGADAGRSGSGDDDDEATTRVLAACTLAVGHPSPDAPGHGDIDVSVHATPLTGPGFDLSGRELSAAASSGASPPPCDVREVESWIRRTLRSSRYVDPSELCIDRGRAAWRVRVTVHILNHGGNIWDAALIAAAAALRDLTLPVVEVDRRDGSVRIVPQNDVNNEAMDVDADEVSKETQRSKSKRLTRGRKLTLGPPPVPLTLVLFDGEEANFDAATSTTAPRQKLLADPIRLEESVCSNGAITVVCNSRNEIVGFSKRGSRPMSVEEMAAAACMGFGRAEELSPLILGTTGMVTPAENTSEEKMG